MIQTQPSLNARGRDRPGQQPHQDKVGRGCWLSVTGLPDSTPNVLGPSSQVESLEAIDHCGLI
jgi:hypothetical protein